VQPCKSNGSVNYTDRQILIDSYLAQNTEGMKTSGKQHRCQLNLVTIIIDKLNVCKWKEAFSTILQLTFPLAAYMHCCYQNLFTDLQQQ